MTSPKYVSMLVHFNIIYNRFFLFFWQSCYLFLENYETINIIILTAITSAIKRNKQEIKLYFFSIG
jgi:hypothetical protein